MHACRSTLEDPTASHVLKDKRARTARWVDLEQVIDAPDPGNLEQAHAENDALARLMSLIHQLKPPDRQVMLLYLDGLDAKETADITGLSPGAVATKIHRIKALLARRFNTSTP